MSIGLRIKNLRKTEGLTIKFISEELGIDSSQFSKIERSEIKPTIAQLVEISSFFKVSIDFLVRGNDLSENTSVEETDLEYKSTKINLNDWFLNATSSFVYRGDSMIEYSNGCILVTKKVSNMEDLIWGRNYVIETNEFTVTKKIAELDSDHILGYSTNEEKYDNGILKHQPIKIKKENINKIAIVLGFVTKNEIESVS